MRLLHIIFFIFALNQTAMASMACEGLFTNNSHLKFEEVDGQITEVFNEYIKLRDRVKLWQSFTGDSGRKVLNDIRTKRNHFIFLLKETEDTHLAIEKYSDVFLDVEFSWFKLNQLSMNKNKSEETHEFQKRFADNYEEYVFVRSVLDNLSKGKVDDLLTAEELMSPHLGEIKERLINRSKKVLNSLGTPTFTGNILKGSLKLERPSLEDVESFFKKHPEILIMKLKKDLRVQQIYAIKFIPISLTQIENIQSFILKVVPLNWKRVVSSIVGMNYNSYVLKRYLFDIESVVNTPDLGSYQKLHALREISARKNSSEFLITFARISLYSNQWIKLKKQAEQLVEEPLYKNFHNEMLKAEETAIKMNTMLSPFYKPSILDHIHSWLGPAIGALIIDHYSELVNFGYSTMSTVKTFSGF